MIEALIGIGGVIVIALISLGITLWIRKKENEYRNKRKII